MVCSDFRMRLKIFNSQCYKAVAFFLSRPYDEAAVLVLVLQGVDEAKGLVLWYRQILQILWGETVP